MSIPATLRLSLLLPLLGLLPVSYAAAQPGNAMVSKVRSALRDSIQGLNKTRNEAEFKTFSAQATVQTGYAAARYEPVNTLFQQAGYPGLGKGQLGTGGSFSVRLQHIMFGIEGLFYDDESTENNRKTEVYSSNALMRLGYCFFSPGYTYAIIPSVGLGLSTADFTLIDQSTATGASVGSILRTVPYSSTLHYQNANLALGLGYEYYLAENGRRRALLGVHLDYLARLGDGRYYTYDFKQPLPGPAIDPLLFRISTVVGFVF